MPRWLSSYKAPLSLQCTLPLILTTVGGLRSFDVSVSHAGCAFHRVGFQIEREPEKRLPLPEDRSGIRCAEAPPIGSQRNCGSRASNGGSGERSVAHTTRMCAWSSFSSEACNLETHSQAKDLSGVGLTNPGHLGVRASGVLKYHDVDLTHRAGYKATANVPAANFLVRPTDHLLGPGPRASGGSPPSSPRYSQVSAQLPLWPAPKPKSRGPTSSSSCNDILDGGLGTDTTVTDATEKPIIEF